MSAKLSRTLYRGLLRAASRLDAAKVVAADEIASFSASLPTSEVALATRTTHTQTTTIKQFVQSEFRRNMRAPLPAALDLQNTALKYLAQANQRATALANAPVATHALKPADVRFSVGQVFKHRKYGYRAVVIGWDTQCRAGADWIASTGVASLPHGTAQPFYHVLVDARDRAGAQVSYVAQDNIQLLTGTAHPRTDAAVDPLARLIIHPLATKYFAEYRPLEGYYVASDALRARYPRDVAFDATTVTSHEEEEVDVVQVSTAVSMVDLYTGALVSRSARVSATAAAAAAAAPADEDSEEAEATSGESSDDDVHTTSTRA